MQSLRFSVRLLALSAVLGCAHAAAKPPASPASGSASPPARASAGAAGGAASAGPADPSEEITAAELASIPDPVPGATETTGSLRDSAASTAPDSMAVVAPQAAVGSASAVGSAGTAPLPPGSAPASGPVWRVQIFASPDLAQAGRVAREASAKFGEPAVVEYEGSLYKVRLGAFASEALAQSLKERAVSGGYPGAFRMRAPEPASDRPR